MSGQGQSKPSALAKDESGMEGREVCVCVWGGGGVMRGSYRPARISACLCNPLQELTSTLSTCLCNLT